MTRRRRLRFNREAPLPGGSFAASFGRKPYGAATAAHGAPVTDRLRSPPYPGRRARQHHSQAASPSHQVRRKR